MVDLAEDRHCRRDDGAAIGNDDNRHMLTIAGSRAGKGTSAIVPNLCLWPGSCVVIDPKGENAGLTAETRSKRAGHAVVVLDPCCGTGAFLVETLKLIHTRLVDGYGESQAGLKIREVAKERLYGFELLPAPYVVAHLQIDLMLTRWGAALDHDPAVNPHWATASSRPFDGMRGVSRDEAVSWLVASATDPWIPRKT